MNEDEKIKLTLELTKKQEKELVNYLNSPRYGPNCPHCKGELRNKSFQKMQWKYVCLRCGRVWIILDDKYWLAGFDAGGSVYELDKNGEFINHNSFQDEKLREKLWDRVRK